MRPLRVAHIRHVWDRRPQSATVRWDALARRLSRPPPALPHLDDRGVPPDRLRARLLDQLPDRRQTVEGASDDRLAGLAKGQLPAWLPVALTRPERVAAAVGSVHLLVLDYDEGDLDASWAYWSQYAAQLHTTWSHLDEAPRWRVVLPLAEPVPAADWRRAHRWACGQHGTPDLVACNPDRLYYLPAIRSPIHPWRAEVSDGPWLQIPVAELRDEQSRLEDRRRRIAERRAEAVRMRVGEGDRTPSDERRLLMRCGQTRLAYGLARGGREHATISGEVVRGVPCPACGRPDAWWYVLPTAGHWARCNHAQSCGWRGPLWDIV
jgi:hypothetical protein